MRRKMPIRIVLVVLSASLVAGCIFFSSPRDRALRRSPSFKDGYADGCAAATAQSSNYREGPMRDEALYKTDGAYRAGWANGYQTCNPVQRGMGATPGSDPIPQPVPGHQ
jgi:hypothetical protein